MLSRLRENTLYEHKHKHKHIKNQQNIATTTYVATAVTAVYRYKTPSILTIICVIVLIHVFLYDIQLQYNDRNRNRFRFLAQSNTNTTKPTTTPIIDPYVLPDGTLMVARRSQIRACDYFIGRRSQRRLTPSYPIQRIHYHFDDCTEHQLGNRLGEHYQRYLLARAARLPYKMTCGNQNINGTKAIINLKRLSVVDESLLRHIQVPQFTLAPVPSIGGYNWTVEDVCFFCAGAGWDSSNGPQVMKDIFLQDMWKMAYNSSIGQSVLTNDDAVIHLRLGDALKGKIDENIGLLPHKAYSNILNDVQAERGPISTISIVTQPFKKELARGFDRLPVTLEKSKEVALDLVRHLQSEFPAARITIHNDEEEIPVRSFIRLIKANKVSICGSSTFCTYPVLSIRNGIGYVFRTERHNPWASKMENIMPNIRSFKVPRLANNFTGALGITEILHWLNHQEPTANEDIIRNFPLIRNNITNPTMVSVTQSHTTAAVANTTSATTTPTIVTTTSAEQTVNQSLEESDITSQLSAVVSQEKDIQDPLSVSGEGGEEQQITITIERNLESPVVVAHPIGETAPQNNTTTTPQQQVVHVEEVSSVVSPSNPPTMVTINSMTQIQNPAQNGSMKIDDLQLQNTSLSMEDPSSDSTIQISLEITEVALQPGNINSTESNTTALEVTTAEFIDTSSTTKIEEGEMGEPTSLVIFELNASIPTQSIEELVQPLPLSDTGEIGVLQNTSSQQEGEKQQARSKDALLSESSPLLSASPLAEVQAPMTEREDQIDAEHAVLEQGRISVSTPTPEIVVEEVALPEELLSS